jgi:hypothetical protein
MEKTKIYAFINGGSSGFYFATAISKDGVLASHASSNRTWAMHDIGVNSDWKHKIYNERYPDGWEIEWVDEPSKHPELIKIIDDLNSQN